jgi:hypothetical protein
MVLWKIVYVLRPFYKERKNDMDLEGHGLHRYLFFCALWREKISMFGMYGSRNMGKRKTTTFQCHLMYLKQERHDMWNFVGT